MKRLTKGLLAACCGLAALYTLPALAASYPDRPIHLIVTQSPGGPSDFLARLLGRDLGQALHQSVIVDNRPGAGSIVGTNVVAKAEPDGYTLLLNIAETLAINQTLHKKLPYDLMRDLRPVGLVAASTLTLIANKSLPVKTLPELEAFAKSKPGQLNVGTAGVGSIMHLSLELLNDMAHIKLSHVPYKGANPAITDLLGGQLQMAFVGTPAAVALVKQHRIVAIATTGKTRDPMLADVPTFAETGIRGFQVEATYGLWVPARTPRQIVDRLNAALQQISQIPDYRKQLQQVGFMTRTSTPAADEQMLKAEVKKWRPVVQASGAVVD